MDYVEIHMPTNTSIYMHTHFEVLKMSFCQNILEYLIQFIQYNLGHKKKATIKDEDNSTQPIVLLFWQRIMSQEEIGL